MKGPANTANRVRFEGWPKPALQFFHGLKRELDAQVGPSRPPAWPGR